MLVLTRKTNQSIMIGDDIEVSVLAVSRDKIRLGITAPKDVPVFRKEVWLSIKNGEVDGVDGADGDAGPGSQIEDAIIDGAAERVEKALDRGSA
jgi:carbon storage regulator